MAGLLDDNPYVAAAQALGQEGVPDDTVTPSASDLPANPGLVAVNPYTAAATELPQVLQEQSEAQMEQVLEDEAAAREARAEAARTEAAREELRLYEAISRQTRQQLDRIGNADIIAEVRRISREERLPMPYAAETYMERVRERDDQAYSELLIAEPALGRLARLTESYADFRPDGFGLATAVAATREAFVAAQARPDEYDPSTWSGDIEAGLLMLESTVRGVLVSWSMGQMAAAQGEAAEITALIPEYYGLISQIAELDEQLGISSGERPRVENYAELDAQWVALNTELDQLRLRLGGQTPEEAIADLEARELASAQHIAVQAVEILQLGAAAGGIDMLPAAARLAAAETFEEALVELFADPGGVIRSFGLRSLPSLAPPALAAVAGQLVGGPVGAAALSAAFGGGVEFGAAVADELAAQMQAAGLDVDDPAAVTAWAQANQDAFTDLLNDAATRALIIMVADGASGFALGRLGQFTAQTGRATGRVTRTAAAAAGAPIEGVTEAGGSALASYVVDGELPAAGETLAEFLGGFALGAPQATLQAGAEAVRMSRTEQRLLDALDAARNEQLTRAEETQAALETAQAAVTETRTFDQDPEAVRELLAEEDDGSVAVPAAEIERLYEEGQLTDEDIEYLQIEDEMTQQGELSGDVSIERSRVLTMRPEGFTPLAEHIRVTPDAVTTAEARANLEALEADVARLQAQMESMQADMDDVAQLSDDIRALIPATPGVSSRQTRAVADLMAERYAARAANFGPEVTARTLFEQDRLAFEGPGAAVPAAPSLEQAAASLQRTPEFQTWFGDSKVVDADGQPLVVYHGTTATGLEQFRTVFDGTMAWDRVGAFFSDRPDYASGYASRFDFTTGQVETGAVFPAHLSMQNPYVVEGDAGWDALFKIVRRRGSRGENPSGSADVPPPEGGYDMTAVQEYFAASGYDGLVIKGLEGDAGVGGAEGPQDVYIAFRPEQVKSIFNEAPTADPRILYQTATIRRGEEELQVEGARGTPTTREVAVTLEQRQREQYGVIERGDYSTEASEKIADWAVEEVMFEVEQAQANPERSAVGWYSDKFQRALDSFGEAFPELVGDLDMSLPGVAALGSQQAARDFFTALIAITSDGAKVADNFRFATQVMEQFRQDGRIDPDITFGGERNKSMQINLRNIQEALDTIGPDQMATRLLAKDTISNLKKMAKEQGRSFSTAYKASMELPYSALIFGPKLGAFYANLMGDTGYLTMDRWWSRTFNRYRGTLVAQPTEAGMARLKELITADRRLNAPADAMSDDAALAYAAEYVASYKDKGYKNGTEIERAANTVYKAAFEQLEDQPFNASDREFMVNTTLLMQAKLAERGVDLTVADIQAVLWYYEKRLYAELGARATADVSYEEIARQIIDGRADPAGADTADGSELSLNATGDESGVREPASAADLASAEPAADQELFQPADVTPTGPQTDTNGAVGAPRGSYVPPTSADPRNLIRLTTTADVTTFVHESGHMFLFQMMQDLNDSRLTEEGRATLTKQIESTRRWFGQNVDQAFADLKRMAASAEKAAAALPDGPEKQQATTRANRLNAAAKRAAKGGGPQYMRRVAESFMDPTATGYDEAAEVVFHELWARGFEQYMGTGNAPTSELQKLFARFSKFITSIYSSLRRLNVEITPEISDVFDRLVASEEAVAAERRGAIYQIPLGLMDQATPAEAQRLRELAAEAEAEGQIQMQKRVATSLRNEEVARRKERRRQLTDEITTQVENEPVYAAITIARTGKRPDGRETGMGRLSYAEVVAASSEQAASRFPTGTVGGKRSKIKNPVSLAMLRDLAGFTSTDELVTAMTQPDLPSKQERVRQLVDEKMMQEFGSDIDPRQLQSQAIEVIQNEKFQQLQVVLTRILRRLASEPMERMAQRQVEREGAPAAAVDREAVAEARQAQERAVTPRETIEASLQRIRADVQRRANASGRRAQSAAKSKTAAIRRGIDPEAIKEAAHRFVRQSKVGTMTPRRYRQTAVRLTAKIERAIAARNYAEAARLMEQRAMNLAIAEQAAAVQNTVETQRKRWRNLLARPDKKLAASYDMDHVNTIRALLEPFDFARAASRNYDANQALATLATTEPDLYAELKADLTQFAAIHQRTQQADPKAPYRDLTVRELEDALALADRLLAGARDSHGLLIEGQRVSFDKISAEVAANVQQRRKVQKNLRANEIGRGNKRQRDFRRAISSFKAMLTRVELWARNFDNDNPNGPLTQYLVRPVMAAIDTYTAKRRDVQSQLISLLKQHRKLMGTKPISAPELGGYRFQHKGELIMAMLHTGNPSNKRKLLLGGAVDIATGKRYDFGVERSDGSLDSTRWDAFVDRMFAEGTLTKEDMDLVQGIWDLFEQTKQPAQAAHKRMYGYYFTEIEAEPIDTPFGTYKGGYAPAVTDTMMSLDGDRFEAEQVMSQQANAAMFPGAEKGFTIGRTDYRGALDLDLSRIPAHLDRVLKFAYLGPAVRNAARLVKHRAFAEAVRPGSPDIIDVAIIPWLQRTAQQRVSQPPTNRGWSGVNRVANAVNNRVGLHLMAGNIVNAAQQITGFFPAATVVGPRHLAAALSTWRVDGQSARKHILSQSEFMRERLTDGANEVALTLDAALSEPGLLKTPQRLAMRFGYLAQQLAQNAIDPTVWLAAERKGNETLYPEVYAKVLDETGDDALAATKARAAVAAYADQVVRDTQSPMRASDVSAIEASTPLARLFLKFYSWFNNMGNLLATQVSISKNRQDLNWLGRQGRSFYAYLMIVALPAIVAEAMSMWARGDLDELEEDELDQAMFELLVGSQIKMVAAMVPYAGQVAGTVYGTAVTAAPYDDRLSMPAGVGMVGTNVTGLTQLLMAAADPNTDVDTRRAIRTMMDTIAILTGLPTNWASKGLQYAAQVHSGEAQPQGLTDYVQGVLTGRDGTER